MEPSRFMREVLGWEPWERQKDVCTAVENHKFITVRSGHGIGKSKLAAGLTLWFLDTYDPALVLTLAPTFKQVRTVIWKEIRMMWPRYNAYAKGVETYAGLPKGTLSGEGLQTEIHIGKTKSALGISSDTPENLQGQHCPNIMMIVDEASGIPEDFYAPILGMVTSGNSKLFMIGNPTKPEGMFFNSHLPGSGFERIHMSVLDSPNVVAGEEVVPGLTMPRYIEDMRREFGEGSAEWKSRVLGEFPDSLSMRLVPKDWAEAAQARGAAWNGNAPEIDKASLRLGCDVARFGDDRTVVCVADKHGVRYMRGWQGQDLMQTCGQVKILMEKWHVPEENVAIDDTGVGGGVTDRLHEMDIGVSPIGFGERALDWEHFANKRSEMYWSMRDALNPEKDSQFAIPPEYDILVKEMIQPEYSYTSSAKMQLERKRDIKKRLKKSPDHADALALCFAPPGPSMRIMEL